MKTLLKSAVALALLAGSVSSTAAVRMHGPGEQKTTFWDSEDHNYVVGYNLYYCDGHFAHVGSYSLYATDEYFNCP